MLRKTVVIILPKKVIKNKKNKLSLSRAITEDTIRLNIAQLTSTSEAYPICLLTNIIKWFMLFSLFFFFLRVITTVFLSIKEMYSAVFILKHMNNKKIQFKQLSIWTQFFVQVYIHYLHWCRNFLAIFTWLICQENKVLTNE